MRRLQPVAEQFGCGKLDPGLCFDCGCTTDANRLAPQNILCGSRFMPGISRDSPSYRPARPLSVEEVLTWADNHFSARGQWPTARSGPVLDQPSETWAAIDNALRLGYRGLPIGQSLARLLSTHRAIREARDLSPLCIEIIAEWARAHYARTGCWPDSSSSEPIPEAKADTWLSVANALRDGRRNLPAGLSLDDVTINLRFAPLSISQIRAWADEYSRRHGRWPDRFSGAIEGQSGEDWLTVDRALKRGLRGLPKGSSLRKLLSEKTRLKAYRGKLVQLSLEDVLSWCDSYMASHGTWPTSRSGPVEQAKGHTWKGLDLALRLGRYGLRAGLSLDQLIVIHGRKRGCTIPDSSQT